MERFKKWRWATWLVIGWTAFMVLVMVLVIYPSAPSYDPYDPFGDPSPGYQGGAALGEACVYWFLGMLLFGPIWYFTRLRVTCPVCGNKVDPKSAMCLRCGYVPGGPLMPGFRAATFAPQAGWPPPPQGSNPFGYQPVWPPQPQAAWPPAPQPGWPPAAPGTWPTPYQPSWPPAPQSSNPFEQPSWPPAPQPGWPPPPQPGWPPPAPAAWPPATQSAWPPPPPSQPVPNQLSDAVSPPAPPPPAAE